MTAAWIVEALVASALLMAVVMLLRAPIRRAFGAQVAYALWALPLLRLVLPPVPADWLPQAAVPVTGGGIRIGGMVDPLLRATLDATRAAAHAGPAALHPAAAAPATLATADLSLAQIMLALWMAGAVMFIGWHLIGYTRFCARLLARHDPLDMVDGIRVIASDRAAGPLAFGVVRRYVAFPRDFAERYDAEEARMALAHELGHHQRGDLMANWVALAVLGLHWWNPLAWAAFRAFRADQELANDARVMAGRHPAERHAYACAIVKAAHGGAITPACHLHTIADLKGRLRMLATSPASRRRLTAGATSITAIAALGLVLTASQSSAAAAITAGAARLGLPAMPAMAVAPAAPRAVAMPVSAPAQAAPAAPMPAPAVPATTPAVPPAPPVTPVPPMPAVPATSLADVDKEATRITTADGKIVTVRAYRAKGAPGSAAAMVPVTAGDCGDDNTRTFVVSGRTRGNVSATVICVDRITKAAMAGDISEADGNDIERKALTAALSGLQSSRAGIIADKSMPADARAEALAGMDEAIKEVRSDLANVGKDD